ncbi:biotin/lipoyl-containing protein, partial [Aromatoleum aromaticum]|nr:dihydrolipoamide acetyltransferase [Aromatoleum aromaticum]
MSELIEVKVPDIGDYADVPVIELFVKPGDTIKVEDPIATLESDKATMDVPSTAAGVVREVLVQVGDRVAEGKVLIKVEAAGAENTAAPEAAGNAAAQATPASSGAALEQSEASAPSAASAATASA